VAHLCRLLAFGLAAAGVIALSVGAAPTLVTPAPGSTMTTSHPSFTWSFPAGETGESITVGKTSKLVEATGDFATPDLADADILEPGQTKWTTIRALEAGKYWWHVASHTDTERHLFSPLRPFTIKPAVTLESITVKAYKAQRTFLVTVSWRANVHKVGLVAELRKGTKRLAVRKIATDNFLVDSRKQDLSTWIVPSTVKKGAALRLKVSLTPQGGRRVTVSRALRAP
jgi:hypothetical protein